MANSGFMEPSFVAEALNLEKESKDVTNTVDVSFNQNATELALMAYHNQEMSE